MKRYVISFRYAGTPKVEFHEAMMLKVPKRGQIVIIEQRNDDRELIDSIVVEVRDIIHFVYSTECHDIRVLVIESAYADDLK